MAFDEKLFRSNAAKENIPEADVQAALDEHYKNNKTEPTPIVETVKGMVDLFTAKHPTLGISPADVVMYAGGAGASFAAGKKAIDLAGQGLSAAGSAVKNKIFGQAGSSVPPVNPTASTQALMATPDIAKPPAPINLSLQDATDRAATSFQLKTPVEKARIDVDTPTWATPEEVLAQKQITEQLKPSVVSVTPPVVEPPLSPAAKEFAEKGFVTVPRTLDVPELTVAPEITGQTGSAVKPTKVKNVLAFSDVAKPVIPPAGAERRTGLTKEIAVEEGKLNAAQRQLATAVGGSKVPETEWRSFQDEVYGKNPPKSGAKGGGVPEWDSVVKTAKENAAKYPSIVSAIENIEKKYPKQSGKANINMLLGMAGNVLGGLGIAKALKEGDTASAGLGAIDQLLANASMLAGKQGALGAIGSAASRLSPFMMGMTPTAVSSGTLNSPEAQALFKKARPTGAVPPPR